MKALILLAFTTWAVKSQDDNCYNQDGSYVNCTSEQRCVFTLTCTCYGGTYRLTDALDFSCDGQLCEIGPEIYCEDIVKSNSHITDLCGYAAGDRCEDKCIYALDQCYCGGDDLKFNIRDSQTFCCNGIQQSINQPCMRSQSSSSCYNSYQASEHVGYSSHFSCPGVCVPILDICQGMSWCPEDVEVCDENLKIPKTIPLRPKYIYDRS